ncbi:uncharacterized protein [Littorina saxatilis]|uniref:G-protein coupled receptors family 1 profile domain-containing protein n=1 Tax=Littorina saxatilis TaxID=31220 RepID=A0AAN9GDU8_9CAEN
MASNESQPQIRIFHNFQHVGVKAREPRDLTQARRVCDVTTMYVTTPVSLMGVLLNGIAMWIWFRKKNFHTSDFLLKINALFSVVHIVFFNAWFYADSWEVQCLFKVLALGSRGSQVNLTMMMVAYRFTSTLFPWVWQRHVTRVKLQVVVFLVLGFLWSLDFVDFALWDQASLASKVCHAVVQVVVLIVPVLVQVAFVLTLVLNVSKMKMELSQSMNMESTAALFVGTQSLIDVMIVTSVLCVVAYPAFVTTFIVLQLSGGGVAAEVMVDSVANLLQVVVSSLNCFMYSCLVARFRRPLKQLCNCNDLYSPGNLMSCCVASRVADHGSWRPA